MPDTDINVALQKAMGERMARWGREYIDPKNWTEPTDRNGRSMGVRIFGFCKSVLFSLFVFCLYTDHFPTIHYQVKSVSRPQQFFSQIQSKSNINNPNLNSIAIITILTH